MAAQIKYSPPPGLLALALVLTTATQLRLPSLPIGLGEGLLTAGVVWILAGTLLGKCNWKMTGVAGVMTVFWSVVCLSMLIGAWLGVNHGVVLSNLRTHDAMAYAFALLCSLTLAGLPVVVAEACRRMIWLGLCLMACGSGLWFLSHIWPQFFGLQLWYGGLIGVRFLGWAVNPNQMALLLLFAPFMGLFCLARMAHKGQHWRTAVLICLTSVATAAGWATGSNALRVAWTLTLPTLALIQLFRVCKGDETSKRELIMLIVLLVFSGLWLLIAQWREADLLTLGYSSGLAGAPSVLEVVEVLDVPVRGTLLQHGLDAWLTSPWFGLGPGSYSGLKAAFQGSESHNSLIDWGTNSGLVGCVALLALGLWLASRLWRMRQWALLAALLALATFSLAHHILRHPLVWIWLVLAAQWVEAVERERNGKICVE